MRKINYILTLSILSLSIQSAYAQSTGRGMIQGNPVDTLPKVNVNKNKTPEVKINTETTDKNINPQNKIIIKEFKIQGVKTIDFKDVASIFSPLNNKELEVNDLITAANKVTQLYKDKGYILSFAYIPQQDFKTNIAHIVIVEGYVKDINITGKLKNNEENIKGILNELKNDKPLTQKKFERVTNILALQPGLKVKVNITPPKTIDGGAVLDAEIVQKKVDLTVGVEAGNPDFQAIIAGTINSLTPLGDQLTLSTLQPSGDKDRSYYGLNYVVPLSSNGLLGKLSYNNYQESPFENSLTTFGFNPDYKSKNERLSLSASYPIILENKRNWIVGGGIYLNREMQEYTASSQPLSLKIETKLTVAYLETSYAKAEDKSSYQLGASIYKGIKAFGAQTENNTNDIDFLKLKLTANKNITLPKNYEVRLGGVYQHSKDILPTSEKISFGGRHFGAAYQPGEIAGDTGWGISSELNYSFKPDYKYVKLIQPYIMLDRSEVKNNIDNSKKHISSATLGARLNNKTYYSLNVGVSKPLSGLPFDGEDLRYYMSYSYQF